MDSLEVLQGNDRRRVASADLNFPLSFQSISALIQPS